MELPWPGVIYLWIWQLEKLPTTQITTGMWHLTTITVLEPYSVQYTNSSGVTVMSTTRCIVHAFLEGVSTWDYEPSCHNCMTPRWLHLQLTSLYCTHVLVVWTIQWPNLNTLQGVRTLRTTPFPEPRPWLPYIATATHSSIKHCAAILKYWHSFNAAI